MHSSLTLSYVGGDPGNGEKMMSVTQPQTIIKITPCQPQCQVQSRKTQWRSTLQHPGSELAGFWVSPFFPGLAQAGRDPWAL